MSLKGATIAGITIAAATAIGAAIVTGGGSGSGAYGSSNSGATASVTTVQTASANVGGKTEDVLTDGHGLPLYYFAADEVTTSHVSGQLAAAWPPVTSAKIPAANGLTGRLTTVHDSHGDQVAYNGHLLYTFVGDHSGVVTGQGVQSFYVATPDLAAPAGAQPPTQSPTASSAGTGGTTGSYGGY